MLRFCLSVCKQQDHLKDHESDKAEAKAFHHVVASSHHYKPAERSEKKTKAMTDTFSGKRVLNMAVARTILPPSCYVYETTDGKRVRCFVRSTAAVDISKECNLAW